MIFGLTNRSVAKASAMAVFAVGSAYGIILYGKLRNAPMIYARLEDVKDKTFIVTGATSGIGLEVVKELASKQARVYMACRDYEKCVEVRRDIVISTSNRRIYCRLCDLASFDSIRNFAAMIMKKEANVDGLINNAGVARLRVRRTEPETGMERQLAVNHMGHFLLTNLLLDLLVTQPRPARVTNVTCVVHRSGEINWDDLNSETDYDPEKAYGQSKLAQVLFNQELARRIKDTHVVANLAGPPTIVKTTLNKHAPFNRRWYNRWWTRLMLVTAMPMHASAAALRIVYATVDGDIQGQTGRYFMNYEDTELTNQSGAPLIDEADIRPQVRMWLTSEKWTHLAEQRRKLKEDLQRTVDELTDAAKPTEDQTSSTGQLSSILSSPTSTSSPSSSSIDHDSRRKRATGEQSLTGVQSKTGAPELDVILDGVSGTIKDTDSEASAKKTSGGWWPFSGGEARSRQ